MLDADRLCGYCEVSITGSHPRRKFCSQLCKSRKQMVLDREAKHPAAGLADKCCTVCNKPMAAKRPHAVYCSRSCKNLSASRRAHTPEHNRARYIRERERRLQYAKQYQRDNPDVPKRAKRKRKARIAGAGVFEITARDWKRLVSRYRGRCFYCGSVGRMSMDHVVPITRGGTHSIGNIIPACINCNSKKYNSTVMEWRMRGGYRGTSTTAPPHDRTDVEEMGRRILVPA